MQVPPKHAGEVWPYSPSARGIFAHVAAQINLLAPAATAHHVAVIAATLSLLDICKGSLMPTLTVLPHAELAPSGKIIDTPTGTTICDALLGNGVDIEHACGKVGACTTCHLIVRSGFASLNHANSTEEDMLDRAWGLEVQSRLSCQAIAGTEDLIVDLPKYSINHAKEL